MEGGPVVSLADVPKAYAGASWATDGSIIVSVPGNGLLRIPAGGGPPETVLNVKGTGKRTFLARLQPIGPVFNKHTGCISCHNQSLPEIAVKLGSARGVPIDAATAPHPAKVTTELWKSQRENLMLGREAGIAGFLENVTYGL